MADTETNTVVTVEENLRCGIGGCFNNKPIKVYKSFEDLKKHRKSHAPTIDRSTCYYCHIHFAKGARDDHRCRISVERTSR